MVTIEHLCRLGDTLIDARWKSLFYALYLTGARVSEILDTERKDWYVDNHNGHQVMFVRLITLKRKQKYIRTVPINLEITRTPEETKMAEYVLNYLRPKHPDEKPWPICRKTAWKYLSVIPFKTRTVIKGQYIRDHEFKMWPHYLRHCRLTHLAQYYSFDESYLVRFTGWTNSKPAQTYVNLNVGALVDRMQERKMMEVTYDE